MRHSPHRWPGLLLAAAFAAGLFARGSSPLAALGAAGLAVLVLLAAASRAIPGARVKFPGGPSPLARACRRAALFVLLGLSRFEAPHGDPDDTRRPVATRGTIDVPPVQIEREIHGTRRLATHFSISLDGGRGPVRVIVDGVAPGLRGGQRVIVKGTLLGARGPRNPGDGGGPRPRVLIVPHARCVGVLPPARWPGPAAALGTLRHSLTDVIVRLYPERTRGFVLSMLLGDRRLLPAPVEEALLATGMFHLLAISGLHVTLLMFLVVRAPLPGRARTPLRLLFLTAFTVLTGASPPVLRAALMFSLQVLAESLGRKASPANTLGWSALLLLAADPSLLGDVGFQLSFVAVLSIITWGARLSSHARRLRPPLRALLASLAVATGTSVGTAPLTLLCFQRLHPLGPIWNLLAYPLTLVPLAGGGLSLTLGLIHTSVGMPVAWLVDLGCEALLLPLLLGASLPGNSVALPPPPAAVAALAHVILLAGIVPRISRWTLAAGVAALVAASAAAVLRPRPPEIWTFDAGAGDAALLSVDGAGAFLIDAGAAGVDAGTGARLTRAVLAARCRAVKAAFLTHPHSDHLRGLDGLLDRLPVGGIWTSPQFSGHREGADALALAARRGIPPGILARGYRLRFERAGGLTIEVLHPSSGEDLPLARSANDASLALRITLGRSRVLFLGDLEEDGLARLFAGEEHLGTDVLVAPHHGRSNALWDILIDRTRPESVIISGTGEGGARDLAADLEARGIRVLATWRRGAVRTVWTPSGGWTPAYWRDR
ncbi:MAG TPA: ComEC/Rec2 family competence protein [Planctomycetota bacterium]|nr:ComEC/Rec2 family competence protein [Planctomycetota bacterium]